MRGSRVPSWLRRRAAQRRLSQPASAKPQHCRLRLLTCPGFEMGLAHGAGGELLSPGALLARCPAIAPGGSWQRNRSGKAGLESTCCVSIQWKCGFFYYFFPPPCFGWEGVNGGEQRQLADAGQGAQGAGTRRWLGSRLPAVSGGSGGSPARPRAPGGTCPLPGRLALGRGGLGVASSTATPPTAPV